MQHCYIKETIELSLAGCQPIELFLSIFCLIYRKKIEGHVTRLSGITRSAPDSFV